ncbi:hypothetical protein J3R82DRAFT_5343 [Butyriboletus roseoflavus]|nr:hypothetical protein J3R82DRAFT_5343 [Butyriboletus roseoflavus]
MAGQQGYQTKHVRLVAFLVLVCLAAGLARRVALSPLASPRPKWSTRSRELVQPNLNPDPPTPRLNRIHGRWEAVRLSLGLPPLPREVAFPAGPDSALSGRSNKGGSRFDLGRKRQAARQLPRLHFAYDTRPAHPGETEAVATTP